MTATNCMNISISSSFCRRGVISLSATILPLGNLQSRYNFMLRAIDLHHACMIDISFGYVVVIMIH